MTGGAHRSRYRGAVAALVLTVCALAGAQPAAARPCATMALRELMRRGNPLLGGALGERPAAEVTAFLDSDTHALRVHYADAAALPRAEQLLASLEAAWDQQVTGAGFDPPLPDAGRGGDDRFDAYLVSLSPGVGARTFAEEDASAADGKHASPAFLEISPILDDDALDVFAHHEFQHALQFALERDETIGFLESTAVLFEERARPDVLLWQDAVVAFQALPQVPLFADSPRIADAFRIDDPRYEYGAVLLAFYLDEVHGDGQGSLFSALLRGSMQPDDVDENEPDWLDAFEAETGVSAADVVVDFASWRALVGTLAVDGDGPAEAVPNTALLQTGVLSLDALDGAPSTTEELQEGPYPHGCIVRSFTAPAQPMPLHLDATATDATHTLAIAWMTSVPDSGAATRSSAPTRDAHVEADVEIPAGAVAHVSFCDVTETDVDAALVHAPLAWSILRTDVDWPDAGPPPGPDAGPDDKEPPAEEPTCGCAQGQSSGTPPFWAGAMVLAALVLVRLRKKAAQAAP